MAEHAIKSNMFQWEGMDRHGKKVKGEMSGTSDALIKATLRRQGINPLKVKKKPKPLFGAGKKKITTKDICVFSRQLATMMSSGVPLVQSFEIVGRGHENKSMQDLIMDIKGSVEAGGTAGSTSCSLIWLRRANTPVSWRASFTSWRPIWRRPRP